MDRLEKHIKNTLEQRKIQPSAASWDKVASQLDTPAKRKPTAIWWAAAATVLLALGLFTFFKVTKEDDANTIQVVKEEVRSKAHQKDEDGPKTQLVNQQLKTAVVAQESKKKTKVEHEIVVKNQLPNLAQVMPPKKEELAQAIPIKDQQLDSLVNGKLAQVLAEVSALEASKNASLLDAEIDSLLLNAQKEILQEKIVHPNGKIDAMVLLAEVETELDQSFRDKVFDKLKDGFFKVRTAVAERNQ